MRIQFSLKNCGNLFSIISLFYNNFSSRFDYMIIILTNKIIINVNDIGFGNTYTKSD